jgi:hypothetical protein
MVFIPYIYLVHYREMWYKLPDIYGTITRYDLVILKPPFTGYRKKKNCLCKGSLFGFALVM